MTFRATESITAQADSRSAAGIPASAAVLAMAIVLTPVQPPHMAARSELGVGAHFGSYRGRLPTEAARGVFDPYVSSVVLPERDLLERIQTSLTDHPATLAMRGIAVRIRELIDDWYDDHPDVNGAQDLRPGSLRELLRLLRAHPEWPVPRVYTTDGGNFRAWWRYEETASLILEFREGDRVEYLIRGPARTTGEEESVFGEASVSSLRRYLDAHDVASWIMKA